MIVLLWGSPGGATFASCCLLNLLQILTLDDKLKGRIRDWIRREASARHVPSLIIQVPEIPYTRSGKKVELAVRAIVCGDEPSNRGSIANPNITRQALKSCCNRGSDLLNRIVRQYYG